jgi:polyisoprenoid-binding protein YceI
LGLTVDTVIDRVTFGVIWYNPLPSVEPALSNEVKLEVELQLSKHQ